MDYTEPAQHHRKAPAEDCEDEIKKLKSHLSSYPRPRGNPVHVLDYIEDALKTRLESLRKKAGGDC
jgi:hypothetical protein